MDIAVDVYVDLRVDLVFNFGVPYIRQVVGLSEGDHVQKIDYSNIDAQRSQPIRIKQKGKVQVCGVRFHTGGLGAFASGSLNSITNQLELPSKVFGESAVALERDIRIAYPNMPKKAPHLFCLFHPGQTVSGF